MTVIGITGNGGVGKTTLVSNIGTCLATDGIRTLLIDGNLYFPSLGTHFGLHPRFTIHDFLRNPHMDIEWLIYHLPGMKDLYLILGNETLLPHPRLSFRAVGRLIELVREHFGMIMVDFPSGLPVASHPIIEHINHQILVIDPTVVPRIDLIMWVDELIKKYIALGKDEVFIIINKPLIDENELYKLEEHIVDDLGLPLLGTIPYEPEILESLHTEVPACLLGNASSAIGAIAAEIVDVFL